MNFAALVQPILERRDLSPEAARGLMEFLVSGEASDAQIGGALLALRVKGCTTRELAAFASVLRERSAQVHHSYSDLVDTCGTGGGSPSFNISTGAAIVAAAAGARIAKHGNRAVTSTCGSADVLEALGVPIHGDAETLSHRLETQGIVFLFAVAHHPVMRFVGKARRDLGVRTVFNQLGPLANPAGAQRQLIGVYAPELMRSMGEALNLLGSERALLVHGNEGLDEISPCGPTEYVKVWEGRVNSGTLTPADFGLEPIAPEALLPGETIAESAAILEEALSDANSPRSKALLPNAAAALWLGGKAESLTEAAALAYEAIASGAARTKLLALQGTPE
jgi:anthranilate phosphoribosyltransferase